MRTSKLYLNETQTSFIQSTISTVSHNQQLKLVLSDYIFLHISFINFREAQNIATNLIDNPPTASDHYLEFTYGG